MKPAYLLKAALLLGGIVATVAVTNVCHADWPRFRGPNGQGLGQASVPAKWEPANYRWTADLGGRGHGSPIVWDGQVYLTAAKGEQAELICLDAVTGKNLWRRPLPSGPSHKHASNSDASTTPVAGDEGVFVSTYDGKNVTITALTHDGKRLWQTPLGDYQSSHGFGSSPVLVEGLLVIADDQQADSSVIALDAANGQEAWRTKRPSGKAAYATPCVVRWQGRPTLITQSMAGGMAGLDVKTGQQKWALPELFPARCVSSPLLIGDIVIGICGGGGSGKQLVAVDLAQQPPQEAYRLNKGLPYVPTPTVVDNRLYLWHDGGRIQCVDATTGQKLWQERIGGKFFGSAVAWEDKLLAVSMEGEAVVIRTGEDFEILARNDLGEPSEATPAIADGCLFVRTESKLHCIAPAEVASRR